MPEDRPQSFSFGDFVLDPGRGTLQRAGEDIGLRPQTFAVLSMLAARRGELVSKDELLESVWHGASVTDDSLTQCIVEIRRAIGDESRTIIRTVPRRGFIFDPPDATAAGHLAGEGIGAPGSRSTNRGTGIALAAIAIAAVGIAVFWPTTPDKTDPIIDDLQIAMRPNSIAVLPFVDMSDSQDQQYFADGIAEEILIRLDDYPGLEVIASTSSFQFRDRLADASTIGRRLNTAYVLEGSVRKSGGQVRIAAQLVETRGGTQVWSEPFDRELTVENLLDIQSEVATNVAEAISERASPGGRQTATLRNAANTEAYDLYLEGLYYLNQITMADRNFYGAEEYEAAIQRFEAAAALDPTWAPPHLMIARALYFRAGILSEYEDEETFELFRRAEQHLLEAIRLEPDYALAYSGLGHVLLRLEMDFEGAEAAYNRARELGGNFPWRYAIFLARVGRFEESIEQYRLAIERDPMSAGPRHQLATTYRCVERYTESIAELEQVLRLTPSRDDLYLPLAYLYIKTGKVEEGRTLFEQHVDPESPSIRYGAIYTLLGRTDKAYEVLDDAEADERWWLGEFVSTALALGETERALDYLEAAARVGHGDLVHVLCFDGIRVLAGDPRFQALLREIGFPEETIANFG
jgi:TolB-like protein/DNA-binding winged helix-turn-helix (wHTH) protein/Tfp pilus assembly protein PilF